MLGPVRHLPACLLLSAAGTAQAPFDSSIGSPIATTDDSTTAVSLSFGFPLPGGAVVTALDVDENGRLVQSASDASDYSASTVELLSDPTATIAPYWGDLDVSAMAGDGSAVYFDDDGSRAVVTWIDTVYWSTSSRITFQCQLHADGRITFCYDDRILPGLSALTGLSEGNGAADPGASDLSSAPVSAATTIYQTFGPPPHDLAGLSVEFTPDGFGGWTSAVGSSGTAPEAPVQAHVAYHAHACTTGLEWIVDDPFAPTEYAVGAADPAAWADPIGGGHLPLLMTADDDTTTIATMFPVRWPDGSSTVGLEVDVNGRLIPPGADVSDFSPEVADLLGNPHPTIAPCWIDFDITRPASTGEVFAHHTPTATTITWFEIAQYDGDVPLTVQATLFASGDVRVLFRSFGPWDSGLSPTLPGGLIGLSPGNGATDPGETDYSSLPVSPGSATVYEFFDGTVPEDFDLQPHLYPDDLPLLGDDWHVAVEHLPSGSTLAALLIDLGLSSRTPMTPVDLGIIGIPGCSLAVTPNVTLHAVPAAGSAVWTVPIDPDMGGLDAHVQCASIAFGANPLGVVLTNVLLGEFGH